ncbi:MAG: GDP-mannose dehydrogenase [Rhodospirillales bacterium CG15_BIG_FIL_POST_REV_8_21_14_020_66_15]|nr:MAG: GDP-mannose dehydrogenase [Rhodospirillales bacterium CG15_BIG_FIL_POST_REV_8_21_14_020_66_15]
MTAPMIGFAGLTHLGLNMAAASAARGFDVVGFHGDPALVDAINAGRLPVSEPGLDRLIVDNRSRLTVTADGSALGRCDMVYVSVDVPTDDAGKSDLDPIRAMIARVEAVLSDDALLIVLCQVPPGFTRALSRDPARLYYQVETLIFGRAVERAMHPERFIVGCARPDAPIDPRLAAYLGAFGCPVLPMRYESAELAKISINMCLVASIGVANTMAEICENVGADWSEIVPALRLDARIGPKSYIQPGLGLAGGNLERDLETVIGLADTHGTDAGIVHAWTANSRHRKDWCYRTLKRAVLDTRPDAAIGLLGLAYKEDTHSTKNAASLALLAHLDAARVTAHDPEVRADALIPGLRRAETPLDACDGADAVVIDTPWPAYRDLDPAEIARRMRGRTLIDPYGLLPGDAVAAAGLDHFTLGRPPARAGGATAGARRA